jgi:ADP-ribosylglycohydrolase
MSATAATAAVCGVQRRIADTTDPAHDRTWPQGFYALVGMALGDALGSPLENKDPREVAALWPPGTPYPQRLMGAHGALWTDDTQMSLSFVEAIMAPKSQSRSRAMLDTAIAARLWIDLSMMERASSSR